ncbi:hypothetical protein DFP72DRAFT_873241 [Ephemerocybe angulata]|uniref:F-box domain-containing protein n=1 Tax=Ephemerocybe angulata TaxID=980116 RepID=A0A8H6MFR7_9AGAR|nr:hypothetical protein DFP72DRAFT_873241 [Tulosesus angulatus]
MDSEDFEAVPQPNEKLSKAHAKLLKSFIASDLPDDICREIFLRCLPEGTLATPHPLSPPVVLTHVCSQWRQVALTTPHLWSTLHVSPILDGTKLPFSPEYRYERTKQWLARAGSSLPLDISFHHVLPHSYYNTQDVVHLLDTLTPSVSDRLKSFEVTFLGAEDAVKSVLTHPVLWDQSTNPLWKVPKLTLAFRIWVGGRETHNRLPALLGWILAGLDLKRNKQLRHLSFDYNDYRRHPDRPMITTFLPCAQLEILDMQSRDAVRHYGPHLLGCVTHEVVYDILASCPNLVVFKVDIEHQQSYEEIRIPPQRHTMRRLKELSMSFFNLKNPDDICWWPNFDFPVLTSLHLRHRERTKRCGRSDTLFMVLEKVGSTLTSLVLDPGFLKRYDLIRALRLLPCLVQLHLKELYFIKDCDPKELKGGDDAKWNDEVLESLTPKHNSPHACPHLQYLKWQYNTFFGDTEEGLIKLIQHRASSPNSPVSMKQVHIDFGRHASARNRKVKSECRSLVEAGLDLRLNYLPEDWEEKNVTYGDERLAEAKIQHKLSPFEKSGYIGFGWE